MFIPDWVIDFFPSWNEWMGSVTKCECMQQQLLQLLSWKPCISDADQSKAVWLGIELRWKCQKLYSLIGLPAPKNADMETFLYLWKVGFSLGLLPTAP